MQQLDYINFFRLYVKCNNQLGCFLCACRGSTHVLGTLTVFSWFLSHLSCMQTPWYLNLKNLLVFIYHPSHRFECSFRRSLLHLWSISSLKLKLFKSTQSCFIMSGIIETKLNYYFSNQYCKRKTITDHIDIEALKFLKVQIVLFYIVLEDISMLLIGMKNILTS